MTHDATFRETQARTTSPKAGAGRVQWVDYAKGWCIVLVVMMHSTLGLGEAAGGEGWLHHVVAFAKPFRMPDFFLVAGLFLALTIDRDWRTYLDRKVVHFLYFYVLWMTIQAALKMGGLALRDPGAFVAEYALAFIEPFGTLWFIYLLPVFFVVTKLTRHLPWWLVWGAAALLEIAPVHTGWIMVDEFAGRYVYFLSGYLFATRFFALAEAVAARPLVSLGAMLVWGVANGLGVATGVAEWPVLSLLFGFAGAGAVVAASALLARWGGLVWLRYLGANSIVVYLAFFLPMAVTRIALLKLGLVAPSGPLDIGTASLVVTAVAVAVPVVLFEVVRRTPLRFLFERPQAFRLRATRETAPRIAPAE